MKNTPAIFEAYRAGLFHRKYWLNNIIAGIIVGVVALPLGMAFAIASGARPEQGIYTSIFAGLVACLFGGSRLQITGPTGAFIVILLGITSKYGIEGLQTATLMAGVILFLLGIARMGAIIKYIPSPVVIGFTAGIAVTIWVGQWENFFQLPHPKGEFFHEKIWHLIESFPKMHLTTTLLSTASLALIFLTPRIRYLNRVPGPLIALIFATLVQAIFQFEGIQTIGNSDYGNIPIGLPDFSLPDLSPGFMVQLIGPAFTIAMLGAIESLLSAVVADNMAGTRHNSNQELMGQGLANIVAPMFGGFAATGAIARTATNIKNGANSPLAGIVHCVVLVMIVLFLAPLAAYVPFAALAAILFSVAWNMSQIKAFIILSKHAPRTDIAILVVTFFLTIFTDLVIAVNIGVILAILQFLRRMANSVDVSPVSREELEATYGPRGILPKSLDNVLVLSVQGPIFFGVAENFEHVFDVIYKDPESKNPNTMIINLRGVPFIDYSGLQAMSQAIQHLQKHHVRVILTNANHRVNRKIRKARLLNILGEENYFRTNLSALMFCQHLSIKSAQADAKAHVALKEQEQEQKNDSQSLL